MLIMTMPRPLKQRYVACLPGAVTFKPAGIPLRTIATLQLTSDEFEAIRLADLLGDSQEEGAAKMNVSRATFGRILEHGRKQIAEALVTGKAIEIRGGSVIRTRHTKVRCGRCRQPWEVPDAVAGSYQCPHCRP
jgi:uncharacterized protein